jgi:hypothetical protein
MQLQVAEEQSEVTIILIKGAFNAFIELLLSE